jgi:hypothetical protein
MKTIHYRKLLLPVLVLAIFYPTVSSQQLKLKAGLFGFFDNREYFNYYANDQTIFGTRAFLQTGITLNQKSEFVLGLDGIYEFGSSFETDNIKPILYIHQKTDAIDLYLGSFYRYPIVNLPYVLLNDTLKYYRPNMQGIYIGYSGNNFNHNIWIDWTSRQSKENKEIFLIGGTGSFKLNKFYYLHDFIITHDALTSKSNSDEHIRDNGGIYSRIGVDASHFLFFDSLTLSTGIVFSYDRERNITPLKYYPGSMTELYMQYKSVGAKYTNYSGEGQDIITGDPLYKAKFYNRLDLFWNIFNKPGIEGEVEISFHLINDIIDYSQRFTLRLEIDHLKNFKKNEY